MNNVSLIKTTFLGLLSLGAFAAVGLAQEEGGEAGASDKTTFVRGWILTPDPAVRLQMKGVDANQETSLATGAEGGISVNPGYLTPPPGNYVLELKSGDEVLESARGALRPDRHYSAVVWREGSKWELKVFADDGSEPNAVDRPLRVLNFADERETLLSLNAGAETKVAAQTVLETKAPAAIGMVTVKVLAADGGAPAQSSVEIDFKSAPSAYVVIGPDYRGRMRPRVFTGGRVADEQAESSAVAPGGQM
jgi:hypothetical protein